MVKFILTVLIYLFIFDLASQTIGHKLDPLFQNSEIRNINSYNELIGSPYLFEEWCVGEIISGDKKYTDLNLRFDLYSGSLIVKNNNKEIVVNSSVVDQFIMNCNSQKYHFRRMSLPDQKVKYLQIFFEEGTIGLYQMHEKRIKKGKVNNGYVSDSDTKDRFTDHEIYYVKLDNQLYAFNGKKKNLIQLLSRKGNKVSDFIKNNKLNTREPEDVIKLLKYYESIQ